MQLKDHLLRTNQTLSKIRAYFVAKPDLKAVLQGASTVFLVQVAGAGLGYAALVLIARSIGAEQYGVYVFLFSLVTVLSLITALGLPNAGVRFFAQYKEETNREKLRGFFDFGRIIVLSSGLIASTIVCAIVLTFNIHPKQTSVATTLIAFSAIPILGLTSFYISAARAFFWPILTEAPVRIVRPLVMIIGVGGLALADLHPTSLDAIIMAVAGTAIGLAILHLFIGPRLSKIFDGAAAHQERRSWLRVSVPMLIPSAFAIILVELDVVFVGLFLGPEATAVYQAAARTSILVSFFFGSVIAFGAPRIAALYASGRKSELQELSHSLTHWIFWPTLAACAFLLMTGKWFLSLFGGEFTSGYTVLSILVISTIFNAATGPVTVLLTMTGHQNICARVFAISIVCNIVLHVTFISIFGIAGAAIAVLSTIVISRTWLLLEVHTNLDIFPSILGKRIGSKGTL
jgi:O-antigen/teichoic acid export membrane protein